MEAASIKVRETLENGYEDQRQEMELEYKRQEAKMQEVNYTHIAKLKEQIKDKDQIIGELHLKVFQEWVIDCWVKKDESRGRWIV